MRVLYVGPLDKNGTCFARLKALKALHGPVDIFDTSYVAQEGPRLYKYIERQLCFGHSFIRANRELLRKAIAIHPAVIWIDKGFWIWSRTLESLRQIGAFLVQHNTDDIEAKHSRRSYRLLRRTAKNYDLHFTTNHNNIGDFLRLGAPRVELTALGYDHERFYMRPLTAEQENQWSNPIVFVGHWEAATEKYILALIDARVPINVYGSNWHRARHQRELAKVLHSGFLSGKDYVNCLIGAKMGLGFVSKINRNQSAGRTFEIPACGTFLLAERTDEHPVLYKEGEEAEFFKDEDELVKKANLYLDDDMRREEIAKRGHERCLSSNYSWLDRMRVDWKKVCDSVPGKHSRSRQA